MTITSVPPVGGYTPGQELNRASKLHQRAEKLQDNDYDDRAYKIDQRAKDIVEHAANQAGVTPPSPGTGSGDGAGGGGKTPGIVGGLDLVA